MTEQTASISKVARFPALAAFVAFLWIADTSFLTYHHYMAEPVPCSILTGCEQVLTSQWSTVGGFLPFDAPMLASIPLSLLGMFAYVTALVLALISLRGNRKSWLLYGIQTCLMGCFSAWLIYLQAYVIEAFCQFCLLSALSTFTLLAIALISRFWRLN
ncbi:MAG TPA: vitamin K epoxide reductase family protein [Pyrinomonadaceae bacterium]|nr:vitamin K epoxide reductase family protein [Pyrinomonadaceae bacterium]